MRLNLDTWTHDLSDPEERKNLSATLDEANCASREAAQISERRHGRG
jgi:hypothetical protein